MQGLTPSPGGSTSRAPPLPSRSRSTSCADAAPSGSRRRRDESPGTGERLRIGNQPPSPRVERPACEQERPRKQADDDPKSCIAVRHPPDYGRRSGEYDAAGAVAHVHRESTKAEHRRPPTGIDELVEVVALEKRDDPHPGLLPLANLRFEVSRLLPADSSESDVATTPRARQRILPVNHVDAHALLEKDIYRHGPAFPVECGSSGMAESLSRGTSRRGRTTANRGG